MKSCRSKKLAQAFNSIDFVIDCDTWAQWHHYSITLREMLENALWNLTILERSQAPQLIDWWTIWLAKKIS